MKTYTQDQLSQVLPLAGLDTYTIAIRVKTEEGSTNWINVRPDTMETIRGALAEQDIKEYNGFYK